jgi:hypothetical protein
MLANFKMRTRWLHGNALWCIVILLIVTCVPLAEAQVTSKVVVAMEEPCSSAAPNTIILVLTVDKQTVRFLAKRTDSTGAWTGERLDRKTFPSDRAKASLRLHGSRTGCEHSFAAIEEKEDVAKFIFHCDRRGVRSVNITTNGSVDAVYARKTKVCPEETEKAHFITGKTPEPVTDIWVPGEELSLRLSSSTLGSQDPGLLVFSSDLAARNLPLFSADPDDAALLVFANAGRLKKQKSVEALSLKPGEIATLFVTQRFSQGWHQSGDAISVEKKRLEDAGLKTLTFQVP